MSFIITQSIGIIAFVILICSYYKKEKYKILLLQIIASVAFLIHYYLLDGITGAMCNIISLIMLIIIYIIGDKINNKKNKLILISILIMALTLICIITWKNIFSIFPIIASIVILGSFMFKKENTIRWLGIVGAISWLIYGIICKSYSAIIFELITIVTTFIAIIKNKN